MEREILNHRFLMHPHIVQFKEVSNDSPSCCVCDFTHMLMLGNVLQFGHVALIGEKQS